MTFQRKEIIGACTLYLGDCMKIMPTLGRVGATVSDPPYGIGRDKGFGTGGHCGKTGKPRQSSRYRGEWDNARPSAETFDLIREISDHQIIWGGQFFADMLPAQGKWLWWDKQQTMPSFGDGELAWTSLPGDACKKFVISLNGLIARGETGQHPTQKPIDLMLGCLSHLPRGCSTILDPYMGSGTTGVACAKRSLSFIGIEIDEHYFDIACRRIDDAYRQADMFSAPPAASHHSEQFGLLLNADAINAKGCAE